MERVRQIAATGIDGIYVDIPYWMTHFEGWENTWASFDDYTVAAFKQQTGLDAKHDLKLGDFSDPAFRKWVTFRIQTFTDFMQRDRPERRSRSIRRSRRFLKSILGLKKRRCGWGPMFTASIRWWTRLRTNTNLARATTWRRSGRRWTGSAIRWECIRFARSRRGRPRGF